MKNVIGSLVAVAGLAVVANAQTQLDIQVSKDGINWSSSVEVNRNAGDSGRVLVRYVASYTGSSAVVGFASLTMQPVFKDVVFGNTPASDSIVPFVTSGNNTNGGAIGDTGATTTAPTGPFGRIKPFASTGPTGATSGNNAFHMVHQHTNPISAAAGNYFRIARNDVTRWVGDGPTTTSNAVNNFNGAGGVACVQKGSGLVSPGVDPAFNSATSGVVLAIYAIDTGVVGSGQSRSITAMLPLAGLSRNTSTGAREASWFASGTDNSGSVKAAVTVANAEINIVPAPGALALLGLGGLVAGRRRR